MDANRFRLIVRLSAFYDLAVTALFVTPWTLAWVHWAMTSMDAGMGLLGDLPQPDTMSILLANLLGSVVVVWSLARLRPGFELLGRYDAIARLLFAAWQIFAMAQGLSLVILPLTVVEIVFGILQALPLHEKKHGTVAVQ